MTDIIQLTDSLPELQDPVVIAAFAVSRRGGRLPARTLSYLMEAWNTEPLARTDLDNIYDLTVNRPEVRYKDDQRVLEWPQVHVLHARPAGATREILLLVGAEPNFRWGALSESLAAYLDALGAKTLVTLRAFPGEVPHTRPASLLLNGTDEELASRFGARPSGVSYEGPTDFGSVFSARAQERGWTAADLSVQQPYYFPRMPNMQGSVALIGALDHAFGTSTPVESLLQTVADQHASLDAEVAESQELRTLVQELEQQYDASIQRHRGQSGSLPPADQLIRDIEELFRGESGSSQG